MIHDVDGGIYDFDELLDLVRNLDRQIRNLTARIEGADTQLRAWDGG